jgi:hypothetical protein
MIGFSGPRSREAIGLFAAALLAFAAGCDWFKGSETVLRVSPFLSGLSVSPQNVLCAQPFTISFRYDDPQNDLSLMTLVFVRAQDQLTRQEQVLWDGSTGLDLSVVGRASFPFTFDCDTPGGRWSVTVQVEDNRGHLSNALTAEVFLNSF